MSAAHPTPAAAFPTEDRAAVLARWEAEEAAVRARLSQPGVARAEQVAGLSGLAYFEAIGRGELPYTPINDGADIWLMACRHGEVVIQGRPSARHLNPMGTVHGGWFATLLDSAVGCAVLSTLPAGRTFTTTELKVSYVRALTPQVGLVRATGQVIHAGRQVAFAEARIVGPDGKLYAHATTTCLVMDRA